MHAKDPKPDEHLTLTQAAKIAPGRPSTNCLWRWCRRGVRSRGGERVRLQHIRIGGKIYTSARWLDEFGRALAEADQVYFDLEQEPAPEPRRPRQPRRPDVVSESEEEIDRELEEAGL